MNVVIDDKDIEWAERLLLPTGRHFNDERRAFIRCSRFLKSVAEWVLNLHRHESPVGTVRDQIAALIREQWCPDATPELNTFLNDEKEEITTEGQKANNVSRHGDIEIEVGTVHSVKGETHTATLYLETFNYENDSKRLLLFLKGQYPEAESKKVRHIENLKVAHVAFRAF